MKRNLLLATLFLMGANLFSQIPESLFMRGNALAESGGAMEMKRIPKDFPDSYNGNLVESNIFELITALKSGEYEFAANAEGETSIAAQSITVEQQNSRELVPYRIRVNYHEETPLVTVSKIERVIMWAPYNQYTIATFDYIGNSEFRNQYIEFVRNDWGDERYRIKMYMEDGELITYAYKKESLTPEIDDISPEGYYDLYTTTNANAWRETIDGTEYVGAEFKLSRLRRGEGYPLEPFSMRIIFDAKENYTHRVSDIPVGAWDLINKSMAVWNEDEGKNYNKGWSLTKGSGVPESCVTQEEGYVNVKKAIVIFGSNYAFLTPPAMTLSENVPYTIEVKAKINPIAEEDLPEDPEEEGFESNQISARLNGRNLGIFIKYGTEGEGYVSVTSQKTHSEEEKYMLDSSDWHIYKIVFHRDNLTYDVYLDDIEDPIFEGVESTAMSGSNILRLGAESNQYCNMDVEHVRMGTGDFESKPKFISMTVNSDSHIAANDHTVTVTINTVLVDDDEKVLMSLVNEEGNEFATPVEGVVESNKAIVNFPIPATVPLGKYLLQVAAPEGKIADRQVEPLTCQYVIVDASPFDAGLLPVVTPVGFIIGIEDYTYKAVSNEFIFPSIIDTKEYTENGKFLDGTEPLDRYYLFYTPHEVPGGMYLATGPTLEGPWTERNTVIDLVWAKNVNGSNVNATDHISACQVVWNDVSNSYFMYFHGPNSTTHYAVSDNLTDWTFGKSILNPQSFGSGGSEASYAKVFEHTIPGLDNKYILMLMINEGNTRKIYWAHSKDGIDWTCNPKPLISPDLNHKKIPGTDVKPDYVGAIGNNVSGPFFMESDGRYFVFFNGSSGHIFIAEVGESLDIEVHWGEYMKCDDVIIDTDVSGNKVAVPRIAAPTFIKNDEGQWYMFFEAGGRLGANIAYARDPSIITGIEKESINPSNDIRIYPNPCRVGEKIKIEGVFDENCQYSNVEVINALGSIIYTSSLSEAEISVSAPGIYIVRIINKDGTSRESKVIVI